MCLCVWLAEGPHSSAPGLLQAAMQASLRQLQAVYTEAVNAGTATPGAFFRSCHLLTRLLWLTTCRVQVLKYSDEACVAVLQLYRWPMRRCRPNLH